MRSGLAEEAPKFVGIMSSEIRTSKKLQIAEASDDSRSPRKVIILIFPCIIIFLLTLF